MHSQIINAKIAQLVEHDLAKVGVAGSSPVFRSIKSRQTVAFLDFKNKRPGGRAERKEIVQWTILVRSRIEGMAIPPPGRCYHNRKVNLKYLILI